ncbi:hypothetical protein EJ08DRAFT_649171 [Tothia fuscella]|uniref:HMG box domain-containing protein n=1 Tax=Tothia fuscella TaxID=1048955 RepID=A0A9P4TZ76_9PEZI|nr:hypothetical protein EJ08DRAFT_649171 [Tothia fuscella]
MASVPVRDMEAWVNRSVADRMKEAEKRNGYITRPMNSFMLYRSAYAERTKAWCVHNNHQVVSSVSGESWPLEPPEVREFYNELARIERINHQNAHPDYKFSPSKPGAAARKRKTDSDDESEPSDLDDPDADWGSTNRSRAKSQKRPGREAGYPARANLPLQTYGGYDDNFGPGDGYSKSTWEANNQGRSLPHHMGQHNLYGQQQYYQTSVHPYPNMMGGVEDIKYAPMDNPGYGSNQNLIGLPGGSHHDLLGMHSGAPTPMMEPQVDPMLLALTQHAHFNPAYGSEFDAYANATIAPGPLVTDYQPKQWEPESSSPTFEQPGEFEKLWDEHNAQVHVDMERRQSARSAASGKSNGQKGVLGGEAKDPVSPKTSGL